MSEYGQSEKEIQYWMQEGPKSGAFLLIIPGSIVFGGAWGWLLGNPAPYSAMGLGAGMVLWGLIVVFRKREKMN
jgi:hypothetical protein